MSYVLSGYKRSLSVSVTKTINGVTQTGYPKTYPTVTDVANGYFTYNSVNYSIPPNGITEDAFAQLTDVEFQELLNAFKLYVMSLESGLNFSTDATNSDTVQDEDTCPAGTPVDGTTTTAEATTTEESVTTTEGQITLSWEYTDCSFDESTDSPTKSGYWNLILSPALSSGESIALTINYELDNQSTDAAQQISSYALSEGVTSGNIIGAGNVENDSLFSASSSSNKTGSTNYTLTSTDNQLRLGLFASVDGDIATAGNVGASITSVSAIGLGVSVTTPVTTPSVIVYPNGETESCPTTTEKVTTT